MQLTSEQQAALANGQPVPVIIGQTECVLVRKDVFEQMGDEFDPRETYEAVLKAWDAEGDPRDGELYK